MFNADRPLSANRWPVVRLGAGSTTEVILLSKRFFALTTHWVSYTIPCPGEDCALCEQVPARGLFYAAVMCNSRVSILELGAQSASLFEQHAKLLHGGLNVGLVFALTRRSAKSPVRSEVIREQDKCTPVDQLELAAHVLALFKFPCPNPGEDLLSYEKRSRGLAKIRSDRAATMLSNASKR